MFGSVMLVGCAKSVPRPIMAAMAEQHVPSEIEIAAALAAIHLLLVRSAAAPERLSGWQASARLLTEGLRPAYSPIRPAWHTVDRLRRLAPGAPSGVTGL
jgi:hypothetical protein